MQVLLFEINFEKYPLNIFLVNIELIYDKLALFNPNLTNWIT